MSESPIWIPGQSLPGVKLGKASETQVSGRGALALLTPPEKALFEQSVVKAVALSFAIDQARVGTRTIVKTRSEVTWRTNFCIEIFATMTMDWHYGVKRACKMLSLQLRKKIDTIKIAAPLNNKKKTMFKTTELGDLLNPE